MGLFWLQESSWHDRETPSCTMGNLHILGVNGEAQDDVTQGAAAVNAIGYSRHVTSFLILTCWRACVRVCVCVCV